MVSLHRLLVTPHILPYMQVSIYGVTTVRVLILDVLWTQLLKFEDPPEPIISMNSDKHMLHLYTNGWGLWRARRVAMASTLQQMNGCKWVGQNTHTYLYAGHATCLPHANSQIKFTIWINQFALATPLLHGVAKLSTLNWNYKTLRMSLFSFEVKISSQLSNLEYSNWIMNWRMLLINIQP